MKTLLLSTLSTLALVLLQPLTAATSLTFSGPGYIAQGVEHRYDLENSDVRMVTIDPNTDNVAFFFTAPGSCPSSSVYSHWWYIYFRPADGRKLEVAMYEDVRIWNTGYDTHHNQFDMFGNGRGTYRVGGWFEILEIEWNQEHTDILKFAADFRHLGEGLESNFTDGAIRYNSNIPVPEPGGLALIYISALGILRRTRH